MKVIDKTQGTTAAANGGSRRRHHQQSPQPDRVVFSFEFFSPKTEDGVDNLFERMDHMVAHNPTFCDITWGAGGSTADLNPDIANRMQNIVCVEAMMHLTCANMPVDKIDHALKTVKSNGIPNVLALCGDPPHGQEKFVQVQGGFACALDLVAHIRAKYGDYFGVTVAGYPEGHPDVIGSDGVDAGADLLITQLFYDTDIFLKFVNDCHQMGITCPIVPGIMPINNYRGFLRMTGFCKTKIPARSCQELRSPPWNRNVQKDFGQWNFDSASVHTQHGKISLSHFNESWFASRIESHELFSLIREDVRPIFWTMGWEQYPQGRWVDSSNPSYGALTDYQFMRPRARDKKLQEEWAVPLNSIADVNEKFSGLCLGKARTSPWSELDGLQPETKIINEQLGKINLKGFLPINSQPSVNTERSDSSAVGWGGPGGLVYQKAYLEFFCSWDKVTALVEKCKQFPFLTYMAVNRDGSSWIANVGNKCCNLGSFPCKGDYTAYSGGSGKLPDLEG